MHPQEGAYEFVVRKGDPEKLVFFLQGWDSGRGKGREGFFATSKPERRGGMGFGFQKAPVESSVLQNSWRITFVITPR